MVRETAKDAGTAAGTAGGAFGTADIMEGGGLDKAAEMAGGVLNGIFGGLPWEMSASSIVDAVTGSGGSGAADAAGQAAMLVVDSGVLG